MAAAARAGKSPSGPLEHWGNYCHRWNSLSAPSVSAKGKGSNAGSK